MRTLQIPSHHQFTINVIQTDVFGSILFRYPLMCVNSGCGFCRTECGYLALKRDKHNRTCYCCNAFDQILGIGMNWPEYKIISTEMAKTGRFTHKDLLRLAHEDALS